MSRYFQCFFCSMLALFIITLQIKANAQPPDPESTRRRLLDAAEEHRKQKRYEEAFINTKAAIAIRADRESVCNAGVLAWGLNVWAESAQWLSRCKALTTGPAKDEQEKEKRLNYAAVFESVKARTGALKISAPSLAMLFIDGLKFGLAPIDEDIFVDANKTHDISIELFGRRASQRVRLAPGERQQVKLSLPLVKPDKEQKSIAANSPKTSPKPSPSIAVPIALGSTLIAAASSIGLITVSRIELGNAGRGFQAVESTERCACGCDPTIACKAHLGELSRAEILERAAMITGGAMIVGAASTIILGTQSPVKASAQGLTLRF